MGWLWRWLLRLLFGNNATRVVAYARGIEMADPIDVTLRVGEKVPIAVVLKRADGTVDTSFEGDAWTFASGGSLAAVVPSTGLSVEALGNAAGDAVLVFTVDSNAGSGTQELEQRFNLHILEADAIAVEATVGAPIPQ